MFCFLRDVSSGHLGRFLNDYGVAIFAYNLDRFEEFWKLGRFSKSVMVLKTLPLSAFMIFSTFTLGMSCYTGTKINGFIVEVPFNYF